MRVPELTPSIALEAAAIAQTRPYRLDRGIDPERVVWIDVASKLRVGVAWVEASEIGPHWMIAVANADQRRVSRQQLRDVLLLVVGRAGPFELAPPFDTAPYMTMVRVPEP